MPKVKNSPEITDISSEEIIQEESSKIDFNYPPNIYKRNDLGLLNGIDYKFNKDNTVDWRKMLNPKYIVLNKEKKDIIEKKYGRGFDELQAAIQNGTQDPEDVDNAFQLILLAGIKELARLRGFEKVSYQVINANPEYVAASCTIDWIPNYESNNQFVAFSSLADVHLGSVSQGFSKFLSATVENRSFVRTVRNFLNIHVVGADELEGATPMEESQSTPDVSPTSPQFPLIQKFQELNSEFSVSFAALRKALVEQKNMDFAVKWTKIEDVPKENSYEVLSIVAEILEKKRNKVKQ